LYLSDFWSNGSWSVQRLCYGLGDRGSISAGCNDKLVSLLSPNWLWNPPSLLFNGDKATEAWRWPLIYI